jgi:osmoprotectant transport system ATP-binding protein
MSREPGDPVEDRDEEAIHPAGGAITVDRVDVRLGGRSVLRDLSFAVERGETLVLLGRSGSGKSTTLKLANALLLPDSGEVLIEGRSTREWDPIQLRRGIGYVLQDVGLFPHFSVHRNVALVPRLLGWSVDRIERRVAEMLELVGLGEGFSDRRPTELSGGERQRVGIARALAAGPGFLLCDEPFGALDPVTRFDLQREFKELRERVPTTVLFVTHDVREALFLADRIGYLVEGSLGFLGTPHDFLRSEDAVVARFRDAGVWL